MAAPEQGRERQLFHALVDLSQSDREERLRQLAAAEPALADRLRKLLEAHQEIGPETLGYEDGASDTPERIGSYRVIRKLGEGGMGTVYEAAQAEPVRRRVAVKVLRSHMNSREVLGRFMAERQALAVMEHPYIAKVLDAGTSQSGQPFFVMELVEGTPITQFAKDQQLSTRDRLRLAVKLCHAVQHAHQKGVIHRDLKPTNVLVVKQSEGPLPKVIDFGIAKALAAPLTDMTVETHAQQAIGTPAYMSPEQAGITGQDVDTRSDVYSIGVMLYELLCDCLPIEVKGKSYVAFVRELATHSATPPSVRGNNKELRGDLDAIVLKSIERDRDRRYETPLALAEDLERYLSDEPVLARSGANGYWLRALARRYRPQLAALAVAVAALLVGTGLAVHGLMRARQAEREALEKAEAARAVSEFLVRLFDSADPAQNRGRQISVQELLDRGTAQAEQRLKNQPEVRAQVLETLSRVHRSLGAYERAASLAALAVAAATDETRAASALVQQGSAEHRLAQFENAERSLRRAIAIQERVLGPRHVELARSLQVLAGLQWQRDHLDEAMELHRRALSINETALGPGHVDTAYNRRGLGMVLSDKGDNAGALREYERALPVFEKELGPDHPTVADALDSIGIVYLNLKDTRGARPRFERAVAIRTRVLGPDHPVTAYSYLNLGRMYAMDGRDDAAIEQFRRAVAVREEALGKDHPSTADVVSSLALAYARRGSYREARDLLHRALAGYVKAYGGKHVDVAWTHRSLALVAVKEQNFAEAIRELRLARETNTGYDLQLMNSDFDAIRSRPDFPK